MIWGILCLSAKNIISKDIADSWYNELYVLGGFAPSIIGIVLLFYFDGKDGIKDAFKKLVLKGVKFRYIAFAFTFTISTVIVPEIICNIAGIKYEISIIDSFSKAGGIFGTISFFIAVMFIGGGVNEEFGWRGFLLPRLQKKFHPIIASIIIGVVWTLWHIPLFIVNPENYLIGNIGLGLSLLIYGVETIWLSSIFTWLFNKTNGCLLLSIVFHAVDNTVLYIMYIDNSVISSYILILNAFRIVTFILIIIDMCRYSSINS